MSDGGSGEKTEEPTPERLRKLREEGNVPKSQDVTQAAQLVVSFVALAAWMPSIGRYMEELFRTAVYAAMNFSIDDGPAIVTRLLLDSLIVFVLACAPVITAAFVVSLSINLAQVGFMVTLKPITPDLKKINPV